MISFIIIGRNEGWKLLKCIQSIIETIEYNQLIEYEIIYVDSNSVDNSVERAKEFGIVKIFKLTGDINAAIARNIGAKEAKGDVFFFVDGDMEINKESFLILFDSEMKLKYDFISGDFINFYYDIQKSKEVLRKELNHKNIQIRKDFITGGLFLIDKEKWFSVNGMRDAFRTGEDMDLGLRLSKKGTYLHRLPINLAIHHTVDYESNNRLWSQLKDKTHLYGRSLLYRKNLFNLNSLKLIFKQDYSLLFLILTIIVSLLFKRVELMLLYLVVIVLRSIMKKNIKYLPYFLIRDVKVLLGFFFFYPKKNKISYISI